MAVSLEDRVDASSDGHELESLELELLLTGIAKRYGYDFRNYAAASLRRRVRRAVEDENVPSISALQERILRDPRCMERFVTTLSVHVTAMFRDPEFYRVLRAEVVPKLRTYPFVRIWHAGCATGEEVYSLAIVLIEEGLYERCRLYATDMSGAVLRRASSGVFPLVRMRDNTANYLRAGGSKDFSSYYTADDENAVFRSSLRRNVVFSQHNLVSDGSFNEFHLILCRNVLIYFDDTLRKRVLQLLDSSLVHFGTLGLGRKESLAHSPLATRYHSIDGDVRLYRKGG